MKLLAFLASFFPAKATEPTVISGTASYYASSYAGKIMANGAVFNPKAFTLATYEFPLGACVYITYTNERGLTRGAHATVTDRGPARYLREIGRKFDLTPALFSYLAGDLRPGIIPVQVIRVDKL